MPYMLFLWYCLLDDKDSMWRKKLSIFLGASLFCYVGIQQLFNRRAEELTSVSEAGKSALTFHLVVFVLVLLLSGRDSLVVGLFLFDVGRFS
jgi:hypothetical protein